MTLPQVPTVPTNSEPIEWVLEDEPGIPKGATYFMRDGVRHFFGRGGWLPEVPTPAGTPTKKEWPFDYPETMASIQRGIDQSDRGEGVYLGSFAKYAALDGTETDPSLLKTLEKAVNTAKPMGAK